MTARRRVRMAYVVGAAIFALQVAGCSNVTTGTPMADPQQIGMTTTTSPSPTTRARVPDPTTTAPRPPGAPAPGGLADATCGEYVDMDPEAQRQVIEAIGEQNELVALNPELWVTMASAMCTFADPATLVKDAVVGG